MYASKEDLLQAKAEYYEKKFKDLLSEMVGMVTNQPAPKAEDPEGEKATDGVTNMEALPCAWCGSKAEIQERACGEDVNCSNRNCRLWTVPFSLKQWNTRTPTPWTSTPPSEERR